MAIKMTPSRRSQLVEMLMKQNQEQWSQNPQTGWELGLKLMAQAIRQGQSNKLQEQGAKDQQALVDALNQPTTMQLESIDGTPMPELARTQNRS